MGNGTDGDLQEEGELLTQRLVQGTIPLFPYERQHIPGGHQSTRAHPPSEMEELGKCVGRRKGR